MSSSISGPTSNTVSQARAVEAAKDAALDAEQLAFEQEVGIKSVEDGMQEDGNPLARMGVKEQKTLTERTKDTTKAQSEVGNINKPLTKKEAEDLADAFTNQNPELRAKNLTDLLEKLQPNDSKETILSYVFSQYLDLKQADKALEFLSQATGGDLKAKILEIKADLYKSIDAFAPVDTKDTILTKLFDGYPHVVLVNQALDLLIEKSKQPLLNEAKLAKEELLANYSRELVGFDNIKDVSSRASSAMKKTGLDISPAEFTDRYNKLTSNPLEVNSLQSEVVSMTTEQRRSFLKSLLKAVAADIDADKASIEPAKLITLRKQISVLQARMAADTVCEKSLRGSITPQFNAAGLTIPIQLTSDSLSRELLGVAGERYVSPEKMGPVANKLGVDGNNGLSRMENVKAQIIVFNVMLAAVPQLSPDKVFRSPEHLKEVSGALIKHLERLEEELEVLEEEQEVNM